MPSPAKPEPMMRTKGSDMLTRALVRQTVALLNESQ